MSIVSDEEEFYDAFETEEALKKNKLLNSEFLLEQKQIFSSETRINDDICKNYHPKIYGLGCLSTQQTLIDQTALTDFITINGTVINSKVFKKETNKGLDETYNSPQIISEYDSMDNDAYNHINPFSPHLTHFDSAPNIPKSQFCKNHDEEKLELTNGVSSLMNNLSNSEDIKNQIQDISPRADQKSLRKYNTQDLKQPNILNRTLTCNDIVDSTKLEKDFFCKPGISSPDQQKCSIENCINSDNSKLIKESIKLHDKLKSDFNTIMTLQNIPSTRIKNENRKGQKSNASEATWIAKFSLDEKYLATGGVDGVLRVYEVILNQEDDEYHFSDLLNPNYKSFIKHTFDIIEISWHKNSINLLTASIDNKAILWNIHHQNQIQIFDHGDIVSSVVFYPLNDTWFASGSFDKMIRIWDTSENKVINWIQANDLITALAFSPDNQHLIVGFYKGACKIYKIDQGKLKFLTEISCKNRFTFGKLNKVGKKVTSIIFTDDLEFLVTTNDSRMRLIDFTNFETKIKYKGHVNKSLISSASYNYEKQMILMGSEDGKVYIYNKETNYIPQINPMYSLRKKNRNTSYECFSPFQRLIAPCSIWVPFNLTKKYREKLININNKIYVDCLMIVISFESDIKIIGNIIELNP